MPSKNNFNVLIIEDDLEDALEISNQIKLSKTNRNFDISISNNKKDFYKKINNKNFDAFIIDMNIGSSQNTNEKTSINLLDIANKMRFNNPNSKIIGYTRYAGSAVDIALRNKIDDSDFEFFKPIDKKKFTNHFSKILEDFILKKDGIKKTIKSDQIKPVKTSIKVVNKRLTDIFRNDPELLWKLNPTEFEHLVAELFEEQGYKPILTPPRSDGGKDIYVFKSDPILKTSFLVECKRYVPPNKVGVDIARQLYGVVQREDVNGGIIVTTSYFTRGAKNFADTIPYQLFLRDFDDLKSWMNKASNIEQTRTT